MRPYSKSFISISIGVIQRLHMSNKRHSYHSRNYKGFRISVPGTGHKDEILCISYYIIETILDSLHTGSGAPLGSSTPSPHTTLKSHAFRSVYPLDCEFHKGRLCPWLKVGFSKCLVKNEVSEQMLAHSTCQFNFYTQRETHF